MPPRAIGAVDVEDLVHDPPPIAYRRVTAQRHRWHHRCDQLPLDIGQIGRIRRHPPCQDLVRHSEATEITH